MGAERNAGNQAAGDDLLGAEGVSLQELVQALEELQREEAEAAQQAESTASQENEENTNDEKDSNKGRNSNKNGKIRKKEIGKTETAQERRKITGGDRMATK